MPTRNTKLRAPQRNYSYGIRDFGMHSGVPTVEIQLSSSDDNKIKLSSIDSLFTNWNWKKKLKSGFARLQVKGTDPFNDMHIEGLNALNTVIDARFLDFYVDHKYLDKKPSRTIQNFTDSYTVQVPLDRDFDEEVFEWYSDQSQRFGNVEFIFKVDKMKDHKKINGISRDYKIYDSDIYLYPKGRKLKTVSENYETCVKMGKQFTWNVCPRMDVVESSDDEDDE